MFMLEAFENHSVNQIGSFLKALAFSDREPVKTDSDDVFQAFEQLYATQPTGTPEPEPMVEDPTEPINVPLNQPPPNTNHAHDNHVRFTLDDVKPYQWNERFFEFKAWMIADNELYDLKSIFKRFLACLTGRLHDWHEALQEYRQLQLQQCPSIDAFLGTIYNEFVGTPDKFEEICKAEFMGFKCCSLQAKDLERHYDRMSKIFYIIGGLDDANLKQIFFQSFPDALVAEAAKTLKMQKLEVKNLSIGRIYEHLTDSVERICNHKQLMEDMAKTQKMLKTACNKDHWKIKCKNKEGCDCSEHKKAYKKKHKNKSSSKWHKSDPFQNALSSHIVPDIKEPFCKPFKFNDSPSHSVPTLPHCLPVIYSLTQIMSSSKASSSSSSSKSFPHPFQFSDFEKALDPMTTIALLPEEIQKEVAHHAIHLRAKDQVIKYLELLLEKHGLVFRASKLPEIFIRSFLVVTEKKSRFYDILPNSISFLQSITVLSARDCNISDGDIQMEIGNLSSLKTLDFGANIFCFLPNSLNLLSKQDQLAVDRCRNLKSLPELLPNIKVVTMDDCISIERLPDLSNSKKSILFNPQRCSFVASHNMLKFNSVKRLRISPQSGEHIHVYFEIAPSASIVVKMCQLQLFRRTPYTRRFSVDKMKGRKYGFDLAELSCRLANKDEDPKMMIMEDEDQIINNKRDTKYIHLSDDRVADNFLIKIVNTEQVLEDVHGS
ncbi:hypothetical protein LguiB_013734 [Lonicera macranthoides]